MTKAQVKKYIREGGAKCPFCGGPNIEGTDRDVVDGSEIAQEIECLKCEKRWREYYKLHDVEEINEEGELVNTTE